MAMFWDSTAGHVVAGCCAYTALAIALAQVRAALCPSFPCRCLNQRYLAFTPARPPSVQIIQHLRHYSEPLFQVW